MGERTLRYAVVAVVAIIGVALGTAVLLDPDSAREEVVGTSGEPGASVGDGAPMEDRVEELRAAQRTTTTHPPQQFPSTGPPTELNGGWAITSVDRGPGEPEPITWDPRRPVGLTFRQAMAEGEPGAVSFMVGCGPVFMPIYVEGPIIRADPAGRSVIEASSCPGGPAPDLPLEALFVGPPPEVRWSLVDGVLRIEHPGTGMALTAAREVHEPLPPDIETPHAIYGSWAFIEWTDDSGPHDVVPPDGINVTVSFHETVLGPHLGYFDGDCNGAGIEVSYVDDRIRLEKRGPSTMMGCPSTWRLHELGTLFATPGEIRWRVDGDRLTLTNDAAGIAFTAVQIDDR